MRHTVTLQFAHEIKRAAICDLLENTEQELTVLDGKLDLRIKPFEVISIRIETDE